MNLLARRLEIPLVIWKKDALSLNERILLAALYALDKGGGVGLSYHDIGLSLHITSLVAAKLVQALGSKGLLLTVKTQGRRRWLQVDKKVKTAVEHEKTKPRLNLTMYFIQCLCEYNLRMDYAAQVRVCPQCLRAVYLTPPDKKYVRQVWKHK